MGTPRNFNFLITHIDAVGPFLRFTGQESKTSSAFLEQLLAEAEPQLRAGKGALSPNVFLPPGTVCLAQYKDGAFYRARVLDCRNGALSVLFIDYGNRDTIAITDVRSIEQYSPHLQQLPKLATEYILANAANLTGRWEAQTLASLQELANREYLCTLEERFTKWSTISVCYGTQKLSDYLINAKMCLYVSGTQQAEILNEYTHLSSAIPTRSPIIQEQYLEHAVPFPNRGFPSNPAAAMRIQSVPAINGNYMTEPPPQIQPSPISQRLQVHRSAPRNVHLRTVAIPQQSGGAQQTTVSQTVQPSVDFPGPNSGGSPRKMMTYKSRILDVNTERKVCISFARDGPELFAVQLTSEANNLKEMMSEINKLPHKSLSEPPMIGTVCLGRMSGDKMICRAIVMNICGSQCKLFFVDFGDTEIVSYYDIFDIPEQFIKPNVFALRFCLSGMNELKKGPALNEAFQHLVELKSVILRVVEPEGPPLIQYGDLFIEGRSVREILKELTNEELEMKLLPPMVANSTVSILVSYVDSCHKFFVQLSDNIDTLNEVMAAVKSHCKSAPAMVSVKEGAPCCALFPEDGLWYRAQVIEARGERALVCYVDYGNETEVGLPDLRTITSDLLQLPAQALKCALKGFEDKPTEPMTSNQLEMLALERTLRMHVAGYLDSGAMLVSLVNDSVSPPIDIAKRMMQLAKPPSQPRDKQPRVPPPESPPSQAEASSPDSDKTERNRFRSDRYFREDKRKDEDVGQRGERGGSFRQDRFAGKPWEKNYDKGDESSETATAKPFRDRRKPKIEQEDSKSTGKPKGDGWKGRGGDVAEPRPPLRAGQSQQGSAHKTRRENFRKEETWTDGHDRRDNKDFGERRERGPTDRPPRKDWEKKENWDDKKENIPRKTFDRGDRNERGDRPERNYGERPERNFGDRPERNFRDRPERNFGDRPERNFGDRPERSNFTPRERNFDEKRSFGSNRNVPKELSNPVLLTTPFTEPEIESGSQLEISIAWFTSPHNFFAQITSQQSAFTETMNRIPEMYKGVKSYTGTIDVGSSVLARFPEDRVLYRATVTAVEQFGKYVVQYIDFGNKHLVDSKDIWQLEEELMSLPKMAVQCSLTGVRPVEKDWATSKELDLCFNAQRYQCVFTENAEGVYKVSLWNNGASVAEILAEKGLAALEDQASVTLKDEPIDLSIIVGQEIMCRVTHVETLDKLHVQLDLEKAALVEEIVQGFDRTKLQEIPGGSVAAGMHCVCLHEDTLHRAILEDAADSSAVTAQLPDYGYRVSVPSSALYILPTELSTYYYQSLTCRLNNYGQETTKLHDDEAIVALLKGNKFIMYINDIDINILVSTLYDCNGQKLELFEPDEGAYPTVVPMCARPAYNYNFGSAYLTHADSLAQLYLQKASDEAKIAELLDKLFKFYEEGTPETLDLFEEGSLCAAKCSDGNWYRATIVTHNEDTCKVQYVDYGNSEDVNKTDIKKLDQSFYEPYCLAIVVNLGLNDVQEDAVIKLTEILTEKEVLVTLSIGDEGWLANLNLGGEDLSLKLVNENIATPQVTSETLDTVVKTQETPGDAIQVYIAHIDTPGQFWLQMAEHVDKIEEIQAELQEQSSTYRELENKEIGTLCVAKYSADDMWYRAEVLDSDSDITTVRFIDYGNTDVLDNVPGVLKIIPNHLKEIEKLAVKSSVNAIPTGTGQWSEPASEFFTELVGDMSAPLNAVIVLKDVTTYVDLFVNGENLTNKLVAEKHATRSEETECGDLASCFASHVNSPSEFWIQLENCTAELQAMEAAMTDCESFPELSSKEEGTLCAAKYPEDGCWYRAQIIVEGSEGIEVLFMDYGNASIATELRSLPDELKIKPALSRKCALQKPRDVKMWSRKSELKFNEMAAEGASIFNVQFIASGDISIVELYLDGKSVTEELAALCDTPPTTERLEPVGQELLCNGTVSHIQNVNDFYFKVDDFGDKLAASLKNADIFEDATDIKVGSLVAAQCDKDEVWYRAKIIELCDVGAHVLFVDVGNKAKCETFKQLPEEIVALEPMAKHCALAGVHNSDLIDVLNYTFQYLTQSKDNKFQIEFLDTTTEPKLVKLLINGEDVCTLLNNKSEIQDINDLCEGKASVESVNTDELFDDTNTTQKFASAIGENHSDSGNAREETNLTVIVNTDDLEYTDIPTNTITANELSEKEVYKTPRNSPKVSSTDSSPVKTDLNESFGSTAENSNSIENNENEIESQTNLNKSFDSSSGKSDLNDKKENEIETQADLNESFASSSGKLHSNDKKENEIDTQVDLNESFASSSGKLDSNDKKEIEIETQTDLNESFGSSSGKSDSKDTKETEIDTKADLNESFGSSSGKSDSVNKEINSSESQPETILKSNTSKKNSRNESLNVSKESIEDIEQATTDQAANDNSEHVKNNEAEEITEKVVEGTAIH